MRTEKDFSAKTLGSKVIGRHQLHRGAREDLVVPMPAFVKQHPAEYEIEVEGGDESAGARFARSSELHALFAGSSKKCVRSSLGFNRPAVIFETFLLLGNAESLTRCAG
jgi:hypothetical protein